MTKEIPLSYYKCPVCQDASKESDKSFTEQGHIVRKLVYDCGTVLKLIQDNFRFREAVRPSEKCLEVLELSVKQLNNGRSA